MVINNNLSKSRGAESSWVTKLLSQSDIITTLLEIIHLPFYLTSRRLKHAAEPPVVTVNNKRIKMLISLHIL